VTGLLAAVATVAAAFIAGAYAGPKIGITVNSEPAVTVPGHGGGTAASSPGTGGQPASGSLFTQKANLALANCYGLSFTGPTLTPQQLTGCSGPADLYITSGYVESSGNLAVYPGKAGITKCRADTLYVTPGQPANLSGQTLSGSTLCVTTATRVAVCYVRQDTTQSGGPALALVMDVAVYTK
jgi:hypothetical protein